MAVLTNTFTADSAVSLRENLIDVIYNVSPLDTPFTAKVGRTKSTSALLYEWTIDALDTPDGSNAQLQGDNISSFIAVNANMARKGNRLQISRKTASISGSEEAALKAGRKSEVSYVVQKHMKNLKRDIETISLSNQASVAPVSATTAGLVGSVLTWIKTNTDIGTGAAADPSASDGAHTRTDGTKRTFTETNLKTVLQKIYISSGEQPNMIMAPPNLKAAISGFPANSTRFVEAESQELIAGVDVYVSDWGRHSVVPNRFMRSGLTGTGREVLCLNTGFWKMAWFRPIFMDKLAHTGDATNFQILGEWTIEASNEAANGIIADLQ